MTSPPLTERDRLLVELECLRAFEASIRAARDVEPTDRGFASETCQALDRLDDERSGSPTSGGEHA